MIQNQNPFVYIRGVPGKGKEVIATLLRRTDRKQNCTLDGENVHCFYYINSFGLIDWLFKDNLETDSLSYFIKNHTEIFLSKMILTEQEREYLSTVIIPWRKEVESISKIDYDNGEGPFIAITLINEEVISLPNFKKKIYKGMETNIDYDLEELDL